MNLIAILNTTEKFDDISAWIEMEAESTGEEAVDHPKLEDYARTLAGLAERMQAQALEHYKGEPLPEEFEVTDDQLVAIDAVATWRFENATNLHYYEPTEENEAFVKMHREITNALEDYFLRNEDEINRCIF